mgnify:CR=1 FL=1
MLGWGSDADAGHYKEMRNTLNDIKSNITEIGTELAELKAALALTEKEILLKGTKKLVSATSTWSAKASQNQSANADWRPQNYEFISMAVPDHSYTLPPNAQ